jgi:hypothetical protein
VLRRKPILGIVEARVRADAAIARPPTITRPNWRRLVHSHAGDSHGMPTMLHRLRPRRGWRTNARHAIWLAKSGQCEDAPMHRQQAVECGIAATCRGRDAHLRVTHSRSSRFRPCFAGNAEAPQRAECDDVRPSRVDFASSTLEYVLSEESECID